MCAAARCLLGMKDKVQLSMAERSGHAGKHRCHAGCLMILLLTTSAMHDASYHIGNAH